MSIEKLSLEEFILFVNNFNNELSTENMHEEHIEEILNIILRNFNLMSNRDKLKFLINSLNDEIESLKEKKTEIENELIEIDKTMIKSNIDIMNHFVKITITVLGVIVTLFALLNFIVPETMAPIDESIKSLFDSGYEIYKFIFSSE